ncbi:MAG: hypothetical protein E7448_07055 [Ruminococcaceae bacterium]|nr:hypothetical protein [Oscillospiraceae bacterium]
MKRLLSTLLIVVMLFALLATDIPCDTTAAGTQPSTYSDQYNSGTRDVTCTTLSGTDASTYYTGSNTYASLSGQSANSILQALRSLMTSTHTRISSYSNCRDYAPRTDCQNSDSTVVLLYTSYVSNMSQWNGWNREHVWPQSLGGGNTSGGGADLHHVRPSDASVNSSRGNKKYGNVDGGKATNGNNPAKGYLGGYSSTNYFEPLDNVKGDVARICLYVYVRWGSNWGADSITEVFQSVDVLLEWMELDPVDTWEMGRNEVVESIQGNRNVFIDYPEYAWLIFGREVPSNMTTPSGEAKNGSGGGTTTPCKHTSTEVRGWKAASCTVPGYTGDTYCKSCGVKTATGTATALADHKDTSSDGKCDSCGTRLVACEHRTEELRSDMAVTCTTAGYTGDTYCLDCGNLLATGQDIPAPGHKDLDSNGECDTCGNRSDCDHKNTEIRNRVSAGCTQQGYTGDTFCTDCTTIIATGKTIAEVHVDGDRNYVCDACSATIEPPATQPTTPPTQATVPSSTAGNNAPAEKNDILPVILIIAGVAVVAIVTVAVIIVIKKKKTNQ